MTYWSFTDPQAYRAAFVPLRVLVMDVLRDWQRYTWSVQGFGMLRAYLSPRVRLHVWHSSLRVKDVSDIHDHPWNLTSLVVAGRITDVSYRIKRSLHTILSAAQLDPRATFLGGRIECGPNPSRHGPSSVCGYVLESTKESYEEGESYAHRFDELHATDYEDGTVTLCHRAPVPGVSRDHANVFWPVGKEWVSAEPRPATREEVQLTLSSAIARWSA